MNRLAVLQRHDAQNAASQLGHNAPVTDSAVQLDLTLQRIRHDALAPLASDVWPFAQDLLLEVPRRLHSGGDYPRKASSKAKRAREARAREINPGDDLLSRTVTRAVPWALEGLTTVFGMGTGVTPPV